MELGMIGLGRMGGNMARRLLTGGHHVVVDPVSEAVQALVKQGAVGTSSIVQLVAKLTSPRAVGLMVPAGEVTENTINDVANYLSPGDIILDGGNSNYKDSRRRAVALTAKISFFWM